jgi:hypothetical protein
MNSITIVEELAATLSSSTSLVQLDLGYNKIKQEGAVALRSAISATSSVKEIIIRGNRLSSPTLVDLMKVTKADLEAF